MAAFEKVSRINLRRLDRESVIDIRTTRLASVLSDTDFDPKAHREIKHPIKVWMAYFNLVRTALGAGVLGLPLAISQAGIVLGPMLALFTGLLLVHTHLVLLRCLNDISRHLRIPSIAYRYGFRIAILHGPPIFRKLGKIAPTIVATFMIMSQLGICTVFVTFTSDSLRDMMDWSDSRPALLSLLLPYLLLEYLMKNLNIISYVSLVGNCMNMIGLILILILIFKDPHGEVTTATTEPLPLLFAFGTFLFNLSAVGVILALDKALVEPDRMIKRFGVVRVGILVPTFITTIFGILGYWSFGAMEENVLRSLPFDDKFSSLNSIVNSYFIGSVVKKLSSVCRSLSMAAIGLYLIAIAFAYPIQCYPAIAIIIDIIKNHGMDSEPSAKVMKILELIARPLFVILSFVICYLVPFQGPFVAFVGNVCTTMLALVFPAMMEISLMYPGPYGKFNVYIIKDILIIILGVTSWVFGAVLCGYLIYVRMLSNDSKNDIDYF